MHPELRQETSLVKNPRASLAERVLLHGVKAGWNNVSRGTGPDALFEFEREE